MLYIIFNQYILADRGYLHLVITQQLTEEIYIQSLHTSTQEIVFNYYILTDRGQVYLVINILVDRGDIHIVITYQLTEEIYIQLLHTSGQRRYIFSYSILADRGDILFSYCILADRSYVYIVITYQLTEDMFIQSLHTNRERICLFSHYILAGRGYVYLVIAYQLTEKKIYTFSCYILADR